MDSLPAMSLGRLEKNLEDCDSSSTLSQDSFDSQLNGFRLTCDNIAYKYQGQREKTKWGLVPDTDKYRNSFLLVFVTTKREAVALALP